MPVSAYRTPHRPAHRREKPGFSTWEGEISRDTDCPLEGNGFELPVPREIIISSGFEASPELRPIDRRRGGIIRAVVGLGKPIELLRRLEEPPLTVE
jgi:hypothetical protein